MEESQLLKGVLEGCVLEVIARRETYGYEIISELKECGFSNICEGTLYPILTRLETRSLINCRKEKSPFGPMRKYFSITSSGEEELIKFKQNYNNLICWVGNVLKRGDKDENE